MKNLKKVLVMLLACIFAVSLLAGCGGSSSAPAGGEGEAASQEAPAADPGKTTIKIGFVAPMSGPLAHFTVGIQRCWELCEAAMNQAGYDINGQNYKVELVWGDTESDATKAAEVATKLCTQDKVDILIGEWTPDTFNPVSAVAEKYKVPCLVDGGPDTSWTSAGPYEWSYGFLFNYQYQIDSYFDYFDSQQTNKKIGVVLDKSVDGIGMLDLVIATAAARGYEVVNPSTNDLADEGATDFTTIVQTIKDNDCDILLSSLLGFQLSGMWNNVQDLGYKPKCVILSKGMHFGADILTLTNAAGECTAINTCTECQWTRQYPYTSSLLGKTAEELSKDFSEVCKEAPDCTIGWDYVFFDVIDDVLKRAGGVDNESLRAAVAATDLDTIYGHIVFNEEHVGYVPITLGQWVPDAEFGTYSAIIAANSVPEAAGIVVPGLPMEWK